VHQPALVRVVQGQRRLSGQGAGQLRRQRPRPLDQPGEVGALDKLHGQVVPAAGLARVVGGDDVRVAQPRRGARLVLEAAQGARAGHGLRRQDLQGYHPAHAGVAGAVDAAAAAALAQRPQQAVGAQLQLGGSAGQQPLGLEIGQDASGAQGSQQGGGVGVQGRQPVQRLEVLGVQQLPPAEQVGQVGRSRSGHGASSGHRRRVRADTSARGLYEAPGGEDGGPRPANALPPLVRESASAISTSQ
jgi:hypothetical protein